MSDGAANRVRVLVADSDLRVTERYRSWLAGQPDVEVVGVAQDGLEAAQLAVQLQPDVVVMEKDLEGTDGLQAAEYVWLAAPQIATIIACQEPTADLVRSAMRAGAKDCISKPTDAKALLAAIRDAARAREHRNSTEYRTLIDPARMSRVISVTGAKGGVGKTTIATNLAVTLARKHPGEVVLLDTYAQFGDVALMLNLKPKRALVDLVPLEDELDTELVEAHLTQHSSGLKVMVGSIQPLELNAISVKCLSGVLNMLKRSHRFIVMDVPPMLYDATVYALSHSLYVMLVANLFDLTTLDDSRKLFRILVQKYLPEEKILLVLNRISRHNRLQASEVDRTFGHRVAVQIPNAGPVVVAAVNEGRPFVLSHPNVPISQSILALAEQVSAPLVNLDNGGRPVVSPMLAGLAWQRQEA